MINKQNTKISKENLAKQEIIKNLVMARLELMPSGLKMSIGSCGELTKDEMISHLQNNDDIGQKIANIHLKYLQAMKDGIFYEQISVNNQA